MNQESLCPIWGTPASVKSLDIEFLKIIDSPRAGGRYSISEQAITLLPQIDDRVKARLTTWLVDQRRLGNECPEIDSNTITMAEEKKDLSVHDRADRLLQYRWKPKRDTGVKQVILSFHSCKAERFEVSPSKNTAQKPPYVR